MKDTAEDPQTLLVWHIHLLTHLLDSFLNTTSGSLVEQGGVSLYKIEYIRAGECEELFSDS